MRLEAAYAHMYVNVCTYVYIIYTCVGTFAESEKEDRTTVDRVLT